MILPEVPQFITNEYEPKQNKYCLLIPVINEGKRIQAELLRAKNNKINQQVDLIICDGGSNDGSLQELILKNLGVNTLLIKNDQGGYSAQLRMGIFFALHRGYQGVITIDGNNKDSIEDVPKFIDQLNQGYDFVQGSRFLAGGSATNTPLLRYLALRYLHAPVISLTAKKHYTDSTNAYRAYSAQYLLHPQVQPLRAIFQTYELLAYLSTRADQLNLKTTEIPVSRNYPKQGKLPTKISFWQGNLNLLKILFNNLRGSYNPLG